MQPEADFEDALISCHRKLHGIVDSNGQALLDELWDAVIAYVHFDDKVSFEVEGVSVQSSLAGD